MIRFSCICIDDYMLADGRLKQVARILLFGYTFYHVYLHYDQVF